MSGNTDTRFNLQPKCQICQHRVHTEPNCFYRHPNYSPNMLECQICGKYGHLALDCYHQGNFAYQGAPPPPSIQVQQDFAYQQLASYPSTSNLGTSPDALAA